MKKNKLKILFYRNDHSANVNRKMEDGYGGVGYYRIVKPAQNLKGHEVDIVGMKLTKKDENRDKRWDRIFRENDVFWSTYFYDAEEASSMYYHRDKYKKKVVIDLDDDYLAIFPSHPLYNVMKETKRNRAFCSTILSFADVIVVSTDPLKQKIQEHMKKVYGLDKKIVVIPNMNDKNDWNYKPAKKNKDKIIIGYSGSYSHDDDLKMCFPAIAKIMDKYPNVYFESLGAVGNENLNLYNCFSEDAKLRCDILPSTWTFKEYPKHLATMKWDIGIAPLIDVAFTRSKSHIKWMEYAMYKIPTIASRVYPYYVTAFGKDIITHEKNGLLVKPSEWFDALEDLILHEDKRKELGENAFKFVCEEWQYNQDFSDALNKVIKAL